MPGQLFHEKMVKFPIVLCFRDLSLGHRVGFYQVKGNIGKGNFSSVKMAIHALTKGSFVNVCHLSSCDKIRIIDLSYHIGISRFLTFLFSQKELV